MTARIGDQDDESSRPTGARSDGQAWSHDEGLWAVVVAGGSGARFGGRKQFASVHGRSIVEWAIEAMACPGRTVVVVPEDATSQVQLPGVCVTAGGPTRSASVRAGLGKVPDAAERVLIHDAARPLASPALVSRVVAALDAADAVVPVVPIADTIRTVDGAAADRSMFVAVQTPQGFRAPVIRDAHRAEPEATDDASLVSARGGSVVHVDGDPMNLKITEPSDIVIAEAMIGLGPDPSSVVGADECHD